MEGSNLRRRVQDPTHHPAKTEILGLMPPFFQNVSRLSGIGAVSKRTETKGLTQKLSGANRVIGDGDYHPQW
jgi:hypothetical protein